MEESERRRDAELSRKGRILSVILAVPTMAVLVWAAAFFIQYRSDLRNAPVKAVKWSPPSAAKPDAITELDPFRPEGLRTAASGQPASPLPQKNGQLVDKEDISFAVQLLNFMQAGAGKDEKKH